MNQTTIDDKLAQWQRTAFMVAAAGVLLSLIAGVLNVREFLEAYLYGFLYWWAAAVGCLGLLMLTYMVGGYWSAAAKPFLESGSLLIPGMALLFLPIVFGMDFVFPWTDPENITEQKMLYLNTEFFLGRAVGYFIIWTVLAWVLVRGAENAIAEQPRWRRLLSAGGLVLLILTASFAAMDWGMSIEPMWFSSIFGAIVVISGALIALSLTTLTLSSLELGNPTTLEDGDKESLPEGVRADHAGVVHFETLADLATLTLAFLMLWAYFSFSQFLIIWSANLPEENFWYIQRLKGGWQWVSLALVVLQFFLPFFLLLSREYKRSPKAMVWIAGLILIMQAVSFLWLVSPSFHPESLFIHWADIVAPLAIGGLWVGGYLWFLRRRVPQILPRNIV